MRRYENLTDISVSEDDIRRIAKDTIPNNRSSYIAPKKDFESEKIYHKLVETM